MVSCSSFLSLTSLMSYRCKLRRKMSGFSGLFGRFSPDVHLRQSYFQLHGPLRMCVYYSGDSSIQFSVPGIIFAPRQLLSARCIFRASPFFIFSCHIRVYNLSLYLWSVPLDSSELLHDKSTSRLGVIAYSYIYTCLDITIACQLCRIKSIL